MSPDGTHVASGSADKSVRLWTLGADRRVVRHPERELYAVAFAPDGARVVVGGAGGFVESCETATLDCRVLAGPRGEVESVIVLRDGRVVSGSFDGAVHVWDAGGKPLASFAGEEPICVGGRVARRHARRVHRRGAHARHRSTWPPARAASS